MKFSNLTIVCLTYGRHKFVARLINYWNNYFNNAKIYILDGSSTPLKDSYLSEIQNDNIN